ncbi:MAG: TlpA family protein disulfide reductase [Acidimicrobiales bacterium]
MSKNPTDRSGPKAARRRWYAGSGIAVAAVVLAVVALVARGGNDDGDVAAGGGDGLTASFEMIDGNAGSFVQYRGTPLVVNFFASWCVPCLAEMPGFERVHQGLAGEVAFLGINLQDRPEDGVAVVEQTGVTYDIARDPDGSLFQTFGAFAMPTTVFIDADGNVVDLHSGEISATSLRDRITDVLLG